MLSLPTYINGNRTAQSHQRKLVDMFISNLPDQGARFSLLAVPLGAGAGNADPA